MARAIADLTPSPPPHLLLLLVVLLLLVFRLLMLIYITLNILFLNHRFLLKTRAPGEPLGAALLCRDSYRNGAVFTSMKSQSAIKAAGVRSGDVILVSIQYLIFTILCVRVCGCALRGYVLLQAVLNPYRAAFVMGDLSHAAAAIYIYITIDLLSLFIYIY